MKEVVIEGFPDYVVREDGTVYNVRSGRQRKSSITQNGATKITLYKNGRPYTKSLALIVARAHLYNDHDPEIFDTPIHLDNDLGNNHVDNLAWRPRWFAKKYQAQYWNLEYRYSKVKIEDPQTGEIYTGVIEVCQKYGLLFHDVIESCVKGKSVFPTWKTFIFVY